MTKKSNFFFFCKNDFLQFEFLLLDKTVQNKKFINCKITSSYIAQVINLSLFYRNKLNKELQEIAYMAVNFKSKIN